MPRKPRRKSKSGIYHIILRGINKQLIFEHDDDKTKLLKVLKRYKEISQFQLYGYCLMDNHIHLLLKETNETVSEAIKRISSSYVRWYNRKYNRCGHLFQERFKSECVENKRYFLRVLRYIHQNPMKAGLARDIYDHKWTSINEYLSAPNLVDIDIVLALFSSDKTKAIELFTKYNEERNEDQCLDDTIKVGWSDQELIEYIRKIGIGNISMFQQMEKKERDSILLMLKQTEGVKVKQISRITGISKSVIYRIK